MQIGVVMLLLLLIPAICASMIPVDVSAGMVRDLTGFDIDSGCADQAYSDAKCNTYICINGPAGSAKLKVSVRHNAAGLPVADFGSVSRQITLTGTVETDLYDIRLETTSTVTTQTPKTKKYLMVDFDVSFTMPAHYVYDEDEMEIRLRTKGDTLVTKDCFSYTLDTDELSAHQATARKVILHCHANLYNMGALGVQLNGTYQRIYNTSVTVQIGKRRHLVSFDPNGEGAVCEIDHMDLPCGSPVGELPGRSSVSREGYRLIGWFTLPEGGNEFSEDTTICEDTTLYAHWYKNMGNFDLSGVYEDDAMFEGDTLITGGSGTSYDQKLTDSGTAHIDREDSPGYFTEGQVK